MRPVIVTGLLVVHDGAAWLDECLDALGLQTRPLDRLVIVDTGSIDGSREIAAAHERIRQVIGDVQTITAPRACTFGDAVGRAVDQLLARSVWSVGAVASDPSLSKSLSEPSQGEWLWLLHDDSAADPGALDHLLDAARRSPSVGVAGPKLTTWDDPSRLLQVGQQVTRAGGRAGGPATGEPDQGQHDHRGDVLSVNTSGMLIRREVLDSLGGFDRTLGQFGDGLDLCWRAHLAGHRVVVVPRARMREAAASANGTRSTGFSADAASGRQGVITDPRSPSSSQARRGCLTASRTAAETRLAEAIQSARKGTAYGELLASATWRPWRRSRRLAAAAEKPVERAPLAEAAASRMRALGTTTTR